MAVRASESQSESQSASQSASQSESLSHHLGALSTESSRAVAANADEVATNVGGAADDSEYASFEALDAGLGVGGGGEGSGDDGARGRGRGRVGGNDYGDDHRDRGRDEGGEGGEGGEGLGSEYGIFNGNVVKAGGQDQEGLSTRDSSTGESNPTLKGASASSTFRWHKGDPLGAGSFGEVRT
jgi:hypothetical protein